MRVQKRVQIPRLGSFFEPNMKILDFSRVFFIFILIFIVSSPINPYLELVGLEPMTF